MNAAGTANRLFIGVLLSPDLEHQLERSILWKRYCLEEGHEEARILKAPYKQKGYLGCYFSDDRIPWPELALRNSRIRTKLEEFFPEIQTDKLKIVLFNQLMLTP